MFTTALACGVSGYTPVCRWLAALKHRPEEGGGVVAMYTPVFFFLRKKCANIPTPTQQAERHFFRFPGPFAHWESFGCAVFVAGVASCACFG